MNTNAEKLLYLHLSGARIIERGWAEQGLTAQADVSAGRQENENHYQRQVAGDKLQERGTLEVPSREG